MTYPSYIFFSAANLLSSSAMSGMSPPGPPLSFFFCASAIFLFGFRSSGIVTLG